MGVKISELPVTSSLNPSGLFPVVIDGVTKQVSVAVLSGVLGGQSPHVAPFNAGQVTGTVTLNYSNGGFQKASLGSAVTLAVPSNGVEGASLRLWLTASGADRAFSLNSGIKLPTDSSISFPKTLSGSKLYSTLLQHNGTNWMLVSLVGGY